MTAGAAGGTRLRLCGFTTSVTSFPGHWFLSHVSAGVDQSKSELPLELRERQTGPTEDEL